MPQLPGEAQTAGGSGDEDDGGSGGASGSGSGQNGSGGGSTSPQPGVVCPGPPPPYMYLAHTTLPTLSGASAAPNAAWAWGMHAAAAMGHGQVQQAAPAGVRLPPVPQGPPQMAPWVGQDAGLAAVGINTHLPPTHAQQHEGNGVPKAPAPAQAGATAAPAPAPPAAQLAAQRPQAPIVSAAPAAAAVAAPPAALPPMPYGPPAGMPPRVPGGGMSAGAIAVSDPLSWWYQNYYGAAAAAASYQQAQAQVRCSDVDPGQRDACAEGC